jgi:hypothetical protein
MKERVIFAALRRPRDAQDYEIAHRSASIVGRLVSRRQRCLPEQAHTDRHRRLSADGPESSDFPYRSPN